MQPCFAFCISKRLDVNRSVLRGVPSSIPVNTNQNFEINSFNFQNADEVKRICDIYDWDGKGVLDMYYFMDIFYALGLNIIKKVCVKFGQTDDYGKKFVKFDEVMSIL